MEEIHDIEETGGVQGKKILKTTASKVIFWTCTFMGLKVETEGVKRA